MLSFLSTNASLDNKQQNGKSNVGPTFFIRLLVLVGGGSGGHIENLLCSILGAEGTKISMYVQVGFEVCIRVGGVGF